MEILEEIQVLENNYEKLNKNFLKLKILETNNFAYNTKDKLELLLLWKKYIIFFKKLKKIIQNNKYRKFFFIINYEKMIIKRYLLIFYFNILVDLVKNFWKHEEFIRIFLSEHYKYDFDNIVQYIYKPNFINLINTPVIFIEIFKTQIDKKYYIMLKKEKNNIWKNRRFLTNYRNFYFYFKKRVYKIIFYISKIFGTFISKISFSTRKIWLIKNKNIDKYLSIAKPWDIFLTRMNWQATNITIPGFWKHMSMYLWTWKFLKKNYLKQYSFLNLLKDDFHYIIESTAEWVEIYRIEKFIKNQDYLAVSRTLFSENKIRKVIKKALWFYQIPYDFIFNFYWNNNLVCSELILKSYSKDFENDEWLTIKLDKLKWALIYSPNKFVKKICKDKKLELIMFIDSIEKTWENFISNEKEFFKSDKRKHFIFM